MNIALILAGGKGDRCPNKLLQMAGGRPILFFPLRAFEKHVLINRIVVIARKEDQKAVRMMVREAGFTKVSDVIEGGETRQESVARGFQYYQKHIRGQARNADIIVVHNGANPLVIEKEITDVLRAAETHGAAACAHTVTDTMREVKGGISVRMLKREALAAMQTPQALRADWLAEGILKAQKDGFIGTDDVSLVERMGRPVRIVAADTLNRKITYPSDLEYVKYILGHKVPFLHSAFSSGFRVGIGEDSHVFSKEKGLTLGGVYFSQFKKLQANSDGDVILHALFNAISSALGEGSLGQTADSMFYESGIRDSRKYMVPLLKTMKRGGWQVAQISLSLEAKAPKIDPIEGRLKESLSELFSLLVDYIGITATSGEGRANFGKGVRCVAIVILREVALATDRRISCE